MIPLPPYTEEGLQYYYWGMRAGFLRPEVTQDDDVPEEFREPYQNGLLEGETSGANGFSVNPSCYSLDKTHPPGSEYLEGADIGLEAYGAVSTAFKRLFVAAVFEVGLMAVMISIAVTEHYQLPSDAVKYSNVVESVNFLKELTGPYSFELFIGGGVSYNDKECQLNLTRIYKDVDGARRELQGMQRPAGVIFGFRTDMSAGMREVERFGDIQD